MEIIEFSVVIFGSLMMFFSLIMIANPTYWGEVIVRFSLKSWFHWFEVVSRLTFAVLFFLAAQYSPFPNLILTMSYLLFFVSAFLLIMAPKRHKAFAVWSAKSFNKWFRPLGVLSLGFGGFLVYISLVY
ncbi:MAG: hypothetical protein OQJ89_11960 [Kangiellaceae bacterium]|nr:hypothetical protein [Kangiellaceae bacterium]MCW9017675.1 hypothetical protein [Kangiellaceae bacterium]